MRDSYFGFAVRAQNYVITSVAIAPCAIRDVVTWPMYDTSCRPQKRNCYAWVSLTSARPGKQQVDTVASPGRRKQLEALARPSWTNL